MYFLTPMCFICLKSENDLKIINKKMLTKLLYCVEKTEYFIPFVNQAKICNDCLFKLNTAFQFKKICLKNIVQFKDYISQLEQGSKNLKPSSFLKVKLFDLKNQEVINAVSEVSGASELNESVDLSFEKHSSQQLDVFIKEEILDEVFAAEQTIQSNAPKYDEINESTNSPFKQHPDKKNQKVFIKTEISENNQRESYRIDESQYSNDKPKLLLHKEKIVDEEGLKQDNSQYQESREIISSGESHKNKLFFTCTICEKKFTMKKTLIQHIRIHNKKNNQMTPEIKSHSCPICGKCFIRNFLLIRHMMIHSKKRPYSCPECTKRFTNKSNLKRHMFLHSNERPYSCSICMKNFIQKHHLNTHMLTHTNERPFSCSACTKCFNEKNSLNKHMLLHSNGGQHSCPICMKNFTQKSDLFRHTLIHTNERPYSCSLCLTRFNDKGTLNKHILIHSNERPYVCSICMKSFSQKRYLNGHMLIHSSEKPFSCSICNKNFTYKGVLNRHLLIHTNERAYSCSICAKRFNTKDNLNQHLLIHYS